MSGNTVDATSFCCGIDALLRSYVSANGIRADVVAVDEPTRLRVLAGILQMQSKLNSTCGELYASIAVLAAKVVVAVPAPVPKPDVAVMAPVAKTEVKEAVANLVSVPPPSLAPAAAAVSPPPPSSPVPVAKPAAAAAVAKPTAAAAEAKPKAQPKAKPEAKPEAKPKTKPEAKPKAKPVAAAAAAAAAVTTAETKPAAAAAAAAAAPMSDDTDADADAGTAKAAAKPKKPASLSLSELEGKLAALRAARGSSNDAASAADLKRQIATLAKSVSRKRAAEKKEKEKASTQTPAADAAAASADAEDAAADAEDGETEQAPAPKKRKIAREVKEDAEERKELAGVVENSQDRAFLDNAEHLVALLVETPTPADDQFGWAGNCAVCKKPAVKGQRCPKCLRDGYCAGCRDEHVDNAACNAAAHIDPRKTLTDLARRALTADAQGGTYPKRKISYTPFVVQPKRAAAGADMICEHCEEKFGGKKPTPCALCGLKLTCAKRECVEAHCESAICYGMCLNETVQNFASGVIARVASSISAPDFGVTAPGAGVTTPAVGVTTIGFGGDEEIPASDVRKPAVRRLQKRARSPPPAAAAPVAAAAAAAAAAPAHAAAAASASAPAAAAAAAPAPAAAASAAAS